MEGTFNKFDKFSLFKTKFRAEVNFANYFIPIFYWLNFYWIGPNICVFVFWILSKYCCDPLVLWLCCSLKCWKNWSNTSIRLLVNLSKTNKQLLNMILFFNLFILSFYFERFRRFHWLFEIYNSKSVVLNALYHIKYLTVTLTPNVTMHISYVGQRVRNKLFWECQLICNILV